MFWIRADGNAKIGAGHLMRCLTIAEALAEKLTGDRFAGGCAGSPEICFLCADEASSELVRERGFQARTLGTDYRLMETELPILSNLLRITGNEGEKIAHVILIDSYYITPAYLEELGKYGYTVLLDDRQAQGYPVDAVINYNAFAEEEVYRKLYQGKAACVFVGSRYVPLRKQFADRPYQVAEEVGRVLITTGGGDEDNIAGQILKAVDGGEQTQEKRQKINYDLIIGRYNPHLKELQKLAEERPRVRLHYDVKDMAGLMESCDLAITAGGTTVYELAAIGVPFICFSYAENQELLTQYIDRNRIAGYGGAFHRKPQETLENIRTVFQEMCREKEKRDTCYLMEKKMIDAKGAERIVSEVLLGRPGGMQTGQDGEE